MEKRKVGRPKIEDSEKRETNLKVRLTKDDIQKIRVLNNIADDYNLSSMVRELLFNKPIVIELKNLKSLSDELKYVRNHFKDLKKRYDIEEIKNVLEQLNTTHESIAAAIKELNSKELILSELNKLQKGE